MLRPDPDKKERAILLTASFAMLVMAFVQCLRTMHGLVWPYDTDFDRDIAFVRGTLDGHFGRDPTYLGQYLWYNPLLFSLEALLVKITGLPTNVVIIRFGLYLNLLGPLTFFWMTWRLFDLRIATGALLSYLFFALGNSLSAATYSPWLYPSTFAQFFFYINILLCVKAFTSGKYSWFILLGSSLGLSFLAHTAPALLIILILGSIQIGNLLRAARARDVHLFKKLVLQGIAAFIPYVIIALPLLYYVAGKYHLHVVNTYIVEWRPDMMYLSKWRNLLAANFSVSLVIAVVGFLVFYRNYRPRLQRRIIMNWLALSVIMYVYSISVPPIREKFHIQLPETVPCYHYFNYLKALQSVFFGVGLVWLLDKGLGLLRIAGPASSRHSILLAVVILVCASLYFPRYSTRADFSDRRQASLLKGQDSTRIEAYQYLVNRIPCEKVILCPELNSTFPVMASGRKMVSVSVAFSNPYLSFDKRFGDANLMLSFLKTGVPAEARNLFDEYLVSYVFLPNAEITPITNTSPLFGQVVFRNQDYTLFSVKR
jgi:hypothetical protein